MMKCSNGIEPSGLGRDDDLSPVYFHTLFHYAINKQRGYQIVKSDKDANPTEVDLTDYLRDLFASNYWAFLLSFGMGDLLEALG